MLRRVEIENFKCLEKVEIAKMKGLTVLTGANNVGKSSAIQAIIFLQNMVKSLNWNMPELNIRSYAETVYRNLVNRNIVISCIFDLEEGEIPEYNQLTTKPKTIKYKAIFKSNKPNVPKETISLDDKEIILVKRGEDKISITFRHSNLTKTSSDVTLDGGGWGPNPLNWIISKSSNSPEMHQISSDLREIVKTKLGLIYYLSPERKISDWSSQPGEDPLTVGTHGEYTSRKLHYIHSDRDKAFNTIEKWLKKFDKEVKLLKSPMVKGEITIELKTLFGDINMMMAGFGLKSVFPIVVESIISPYKSTIIIEEPEVHLYGRAQVVLLDLFLEMLRKNQEKQIIFTTHSGDLLSEIWHKVNPEGGKSSFKNQIVTYDFRKGKDGTRYVKKIKIIGKNRKDYYHFMFDELGHITIP